MARGTKAPVSASMDIKTVPLEDINEAVYNPRTITDDELEGLKTSLATFGQQENLIINKDRTLISGHQRLKAMKALGWSEAVCNVVDLSKHDEKKLNVLMNSQAISGNWDFEALSLILDELRLDDDYAALRLDQLEVDLEPTDVEEDEAPEVDEDNPPESLPGEVYQLGPHRVLCGSATDAEAITRLLAGQRVDLYLTDPPYNVDYTGKTKDALKIENDQMGDDDFLSFLTDANMAVDPHLKAGAAFYIFHADSEGFNFRYAVRNTGWMLKQTLVWVKNSMVMGRQDYQWQHEPILYGWKEGSAHAWYSDRKQTTILNFDRPTQSREHPTMKPLTILAYLVCNSSKAGDLVFDSFLGSGSTLVACEQKNRVCYGSELDPRYVDVIRKRYANAIGRGLEWQEATPAL